MEFAWYGLATGINPWRVLAANLTLDWDFGLRPSAVVTLSGAAVVAAVVLRRILGAATTWFSARRARATVGG
jgi:hypothetical protein